LTILKCCLVGLLTVLIGAMISIMSIIGFLFAKARAEGHGVGWDPISMFRNSAIPWILLAGAFLVGFLWEYRKVAR
jgi:hypothetical protein